MLKVIKITGTNESFQVLSEGKIITTLQKNNLSLNGKELFDNLLTSLDLSTKLTFDTEIDAGIVEPNEKRIVKDLVGIMDNIALKINEKFKLQTDDVDAFLDDNFVSAN